MGDDEPIIWRQEDTDRWVAAVEQRERSLRPILDLLLDVAAPQPGERVLDVGCGGGPTTAALADAVLTEGSRDGEVVGLDLAPELVELARQRVGRDGVRWLVGDATTLDLPSAHFDLVLSRFGVMFFADPVAAFAHQAEATRPGGRLAMSVWPPRTEVETFTLAYEAARDALDRAGATYDEPAPDRGPFSLGDPSLMHEILGAAGWSGVVVDTVRVRLPVGPPGADLLELGRQSVGMGHAGVLLEDAPDAVRADAARDLAERLAAFETDDGVFIDTTIRVVTAVIRSGPAAS